MKKLKINLLFSTFVLLILLISLIYTLYITKNNIYKSNYEGNEKVIIGQVVDVSKKDYGLKLTVKAKEKIIVNYYSDIDIKLGDKITIKGALKRPNKNTVFNLFNYRNYLLSNKIYWQFTADSITKLDDNNNYIYKIKNKLNDKFNSYKSKDYLTMLVLGDKGMMDDEAINTYQKIGISHLFAISGMHISIIAGIILFITKILFKKEIINYLITIIFLILYACLIGFSPSVIRATLLFILLAINKLFNLKIKTIWLLLFILSVLLLINPYYIYNSGFLFSFTVSFFLILFNKIISSFKNYFLRLIIISLISFLVSIPILVNNYFEINIITVLSNLIFVPLITILTIPLTFITVFLPFLDTFLNGMFSILEFLANLFSNISIIIPLQKMDAFLIAIYYAITIFVIYNIKKIRYLLLIFIILFFQYYRNIFENTTYLTTLDVGQGDSILIKMPHNKGNILIDTGGSIFENSYSIVLNKTIPYLKSIGVKKLDYLILTHGDYDHMGEAINLVNNFKVEKVIFNCGEYNDLEKELIEVLDKKKIKYYSYIKELNIDNNKLYFLNNKDYGIENDNSSVIYTELNNHKFLFMGDASVEVEEDLIEKYNLQDIDILKVGHHGSKTSSSKSFIDEINPKYSVISVGKNNRYGHPNKEVLENLDDSKIYRTDIDGSIMFKIKNNKLQIETCPP